MVKFVVCFWPIISWGSSCEQHLCCTQEPLRVSTPRFCVAALLYAVVLKCPEDTARFSLTEDGIVMLVVKISTVASDLEDFSLGNLVRSASVWANLTCSMPSRCRAKSTWSASAFGIRMQNHTGLVDRDTQLLFPWGEILFLMQTRHQGRHLPSGYSNWVKLHFFLWTIPSIFKPSLCSYTYIIILNFFTLIVNLFSSFSSSAGETMRIASSEFADDPCSSVKRGTMVRAARALLSAVTRLLILADMADVMRLLSHLKIVSARPQGLLLDWVEFSEEFCIFVWNSFVYNIVKKDLLRSVLFFLHLFLLLFEHMHY